MRTSLALAALAVAGLAVPASATSGPTPTPPSDCVTLLALADDGASDGCDTLGERSIAGGQPARNLRLVVATGSATATLTCGGLNGPTSVTVILDGPGTASKVLPQEPGSGYCWVIVTATSSLTTAVAGNLSTVVFN